MSDDWAQRTFERLQEEERRQRHDEELELQRRNMVLSKAPHMWSELREAIIGKANKLNEFFGQGKEYVKILDRQTLMLRSSKGRLDLYFKPDVPVITCTYGRGDEEETTAEVSFNVKQGEVVWGGFGKSTTQETAEFLLGMVT